MKFIPGCLKNLAEVISDVLVERCSGLKNNNSVPLQYDTSGVG